MAPQPAERPAAKPSKRELLYKMARGPAAADSPTGEGPPSPPPPEIPLRSLHLVLQASPGRGTALARGLAGVLRGVGDDYVPPEPKSRTYYPPQTAPSGDDEGRIARRSSFGRRSSFARRGSFSGAPNPTGGSFSRRSSLVGSGTGSQPGASEAEADPGGEGSEPAAVAGTAGAAAGARSPQKRASQLSSVSLLSGKAVVRLPSATAGGGWLRCVHLEGADFDADDVGMLARALWRNTVLRELRLRDNKRPLRHEGASHLAALLRHNSTLELLDLSNIGL